MSAGALSSPGSIRDLLSQPQVLRLFGSSMVGRLPMGAIGLVLILHVREVTGSYAAGGLAAGCRARARGVGPRHGPRDRPPRADA